VELEPKFGSRHAGIMNEREGEIFVRLGGVNVPVPRGRFD